MRHLLGLLGLINLGLAGLNLYFYLQFGEWFFLAVIPISLGAGIFCFIWLIRLKIKGGK